MVKEAGRCTRAPARATSPAAASSRTLQVGVCVYLHILVAVHDLVLALDGEGGWTLHKGARKGDESSSSEFEDITGVSMAWRDRGSET